MSIPSLRVHTSGIFAKGQLYVALSRAITLAGLQIVGSLPNLLLLKPDPIVVDFISKIQSVKV
jgi:hypothetical protein